MGIPAGSPWSVATRHSPWDSPAVSNRSIRYEPFIVSKWNRRSRFGVIISDGQTATLAGSPVLLLAAGATGTGAVSAGVAVASPVPGGRHRRRRGTAIGV